MWKSLSVVWWLSYLPLDPRFTGSNPADDDGFLRALRIRSTTFFERNESRPSHVVRYYGMLQDPYDMNEILVAKIHGYLLPGFSAFLLGVFVTARELWWVNQE
jgi:hypothetical protein